MLQLFMAFENHQKCLIGTARFLARKFKYSCKMRKILDIVYLTQHDYRDNNEKESVCTFSIRIGYITRYYACLKWLCFMHFRKSLVVKSTTLFDDNNVVVLHLLCSLFLKKS